MNLRTKTGTHDTDEEAYIKRRFGSEENMRKEHRERRKKFYTANTFYGRIMLNKISE